MLNIGARKEREVDDVSRLSDAELIAQLADLSKQLGVNVKVNYSFHKHDGADQALDVSPSDTPTDADSESDKR
jgi:hypothetical protein